MRGQQLAVAVWCVLGFGCASAARAGATRGCSAVTRNAARSTSRSAPRVFEGAARYDLPRRLPVLPSHEGGQALDEALRALRGSTPASTPATSSAAKRAPDVLDAAEVAVEQLSDDGDD